MNTQDLIQIDNILKKRLKNFATKKDLQRFSTKSDLKRFATKADLKKELAKLPTKKDLHREIDDVSNLIQELDARKADKTELKNLEKRVDKLETPFHTS